jgi:hypothetical protein
LAAEPEATFVPQWPQKAADRGTISPHAAHGDAIGPPHSPQNRYDAGMAAPQAGHEVPPASSPALRLSSGPPGGG